MKRWDTVGTVIRKLKGSISVDELYFKGEPLQESRFGLSYSAQSECILQAFEMLLYVKTETGKVIPLKGKNPLQLE